MASHVPPWAPRPASKANNPPSSQPPPPNFRANPNSLADNLHNLNFNPGPPRAPSPLPGAPFSRQATQPRPPSGPPVSPFPPTFSHPAPFASRPPNQPSPSVVPPPGARPPPLVSSASGGGLASTGQPVFASGALPGGQQRFPPLGSAPQPPVRPPPTMAMAMAAARAPPQPPTTASRPLMGSSPIRAPPVQPASPFSAAPQARQPPTTAYPYGQPTWPLQPGQVSFKNSYQCVFSRILRSLLFLMSYIFFLIGNKNFITRKEGQSPRRHAMPKLIFNFH